MLSSFISFAPYKTELINHENSHLDLFVVKTQTCQINVKSHMTAEGLIMLQKF